MLYAYVERFDVTFLKLNKRPQFIYLLKKKGPTQLWYCTWKQIYVDSTMQNS